MAVPTVDYKTCFCIEHFDYAMDEDRMLVGIPTVEAVEIATDCPSHGYLVEWEPSDDGEYERPLYESSTYW